MLLYNFLGINNKLLVSKLLYLNTDKSEKTGSLPCYTFPFGSYEGMVANDTFESLKVLHQINRKCFLKGTIIHIQVSINGGGYDTFFIGSTDPNYFAILCISYYTKPYYAKYDAYSGWSKKQFIVTET